tara:strand:+ start:179 stop:601 length:423 start_codon:yes stop_codon:yes gene_type:complete
MIKERKFHRDLRSEHNCEGLTHLWWELFDSRRKGEEGSAFRFMEREPVLILDDIIKEHQRYRPSIELGYTSKPYADLLGLPTISSYRVGKGVRLKVLNAQKRMFLVENLIIRGIKRIAVSDKYVEFDTDNYLYKPKLYIR